MHENTQAQDRASATVRTPNAVQGQASVTGNWRMRAFAPDGRLLHQADWQNIVVDDGLDYLLTAGLAGGTQIGSWFVGLTDGTPTVAAGDTLGSHTGWSAVSAYTESGRQAWSAGSVNNQTVSNSASTATFTINADGTTIGGAFLASAATGTSGTLYAVGAFTGGDVTLSSGSTLEITAEFTTAAA